jgi:hypothetical protein
VGRFSYLFIVSDRAGGVGGYSTSLVLFEGSP